MSPEAARRIWAECVRPGHVAAVYNVLLVLALQGSVPALREYLARAVPASEGEERESPEAYRERLCEFLREARASLPGHSNRLEDL